jgi:S-adenosyl methyltransferase
MTGESPSGDELLRRLNTAVAHPARIYDVWLGGKDNFEADREAAAAGLEVAPSTVQSVRANRAFLARAAGYLAGGEGIRQFLDIGTGLPSANNTHEVAQAVAPESRVVYVDNDPVVMLHAQTLLTGSAPGATDYIEADLRDPGTILAQAARTLDFTRPVAVMLVAILHFISDDDHPYEIVNSLLDAAAPGSFLVLSHMANDILSEEEAAFAREYNKRSSAKVAQRNREEVARFFTGLDLVEPGVVPVSKWRPRSEVEAAAPTSMWGGVARKTA